MKSLVGFIFLAAFSSSQCFADLYVIDGTDAGMHASVHFSASHVGISTLRGRFNDIRGSFNYDQDDIENASVEVFIDPASVDTNHAERDIHLTSSDYIDATTYPEASFVSTSVEQVGDGQFQVTGDFTLHGVTRPVTLDMHRTGEGETFFGDYRVGFDGSTTLQLADFGMPDMSIDIQLSVEGIRQ